MLLISHSGGTFGTLNCANLLKGYTEDLFCITSEWDTCIARAVRAGRPGAPPSFKMASYVFSTFCGLRPAEPCSLTVAATHELLTQAYCTLPLPLPLPLPLTLPLALALALALPLPLTPALLTQAYCSIRRVPQ